MVHSLLDWPSCHISGCFSPTIPTVHLCVTLGSFKLTVDFGPYMGLDHVLAHMHPKTSNLEPICNLLSLHHMDAVVPHH